MDGLHFNLDRTDASAVSVAADRRRWRHALAWSGGFVALLWLILALQTVLGFNPGLLGVRPRTLEGLIGVVTAPLVHSGFAHLFANTSALLALGTLALRLYPRASRWALPMIWLGSGLLVWWLARPASHIGASGLAHGLMFFIFGMGLLRRERLAILASMVVFFLYGGMIYGVLPQDPKISFEYHLFGSLWGVVAALALHRLDPLPPRQRYDWEDEDEDEEWPPVEDPTDARPPL